MTRTSLFALLLLAPSLASQATVRVVDDDGGAGVDFTDLQAAIDAASSGDVLLVRDGTYLPFTLDAKGLSIVADEGASVSVAGPAGVVTSVVSNLAAGDRVTLCGLTFVPPMSVTGDLVRVEDCAGTVWFEEVTLETTGSLPFGGATNQVQALHVQDCARVVLVGSTVRGVGGAPQGQGFEPGSRALDADSSTIHAFDTTFLGGGSLVTGGTGPDGIRVTGGFLSLEGCSVVGGGGGSGGAPSPGRGFGGVGLSVLGAEVWSIGTSIVGGPGGLGIFGEVGPQGAATEVPSGTLTEVAATDVLLATQRVVRDDDSATIDVTTVPGAGVVLAFAPAADPFFLPGLPATIAVGPTFGTIVLGLADGAGALTLDVGIPDLPPTIDAVGYVLQAAAVLPTSGIAISNPTRVTIVRDVF